MLKGRDCSSVKFPMLARTVHSGEICSAVTVPTVAIGGINAGNIGKLRKSGIDGVAVVSAIFAADDIGKATRELLRLSQDVVSSGRR